ncbi:MAG TPA: multicopper oxidase [Candidatus Acidoferrum sp.]|nr:multicopper oxidase [Candidatus Acidoferrum sp.]
MLIDRRDFLKFSVLGLSALHASLRAFADPVAAPIVKPGDLTPYIDALPICPALKPSSITKRGTNYVMRMTEFSHQFHSQLLPTTVWGFERSYPGPVIEASVEQPVSIRWENHLPPRHLLPVDPHIHGSGPPVPQVRTSPHLHGARVRSDDDGLPERWFETGKAVTYHYPNQQRPTMLWYHDHALGITRLNNYAGLSGVYLLRGEEEAKLDLPRGNYEIPFVVQDRRLDDEARLQYIPTEMDGTPHPDGDWGPEFFGDLPVVNGAIYPVLDVEPRLYRFRILNAANARFFRLFFSRTQTDFVAFAFTVIGADGGLLSSPVVVPSLLLAPAERADILVDFTDMEGEEFILANNAPAPFPGSQAGWQSAAKLPHLMKIRVNRPVQSAFTKRDWWAIPVERLNRSTAVTTRDLVLTEDLDENQKSLGLRINGKGYAAPVTERPRLGSTEIWRFINTTDDAHPIHLHLVQFQIIDRTPFDLQLFLDKGQLALGTPADPEATEGGWKDTVRADAGQVLRVAVRFDGYPGRYVYHCHMLEHEDNDMMRPFEVIV